MGLGAGLCAAEIVDFYTSKGPAIFGAGRRVGRLWRSKHGPDRLWAALVDVFGDRLLGSSTKRLVIPSYSLDTNDVYVFKTPHHPRPGERPFLGPFAWRCSARVDGDSVTRSG